ncbi:hypothetical protein SAMN04487972_12215 [Paracoccus halophilus]|uniref:Uncharacterized protein n=1 Tax=Paracoccus halophilus TaxID=376733 RepID=A0A099EZD7_9RHOB|nr:hypothetical protein [Paracoccus halophilus]KGJ03348.1 hypothetical protein IT41_14375 [Paracoccus halophilus]SFA58808.1 hypothetical protein SAMN04487972_12215 [Paracoccus halophilus]
MLGLSLNLSGAAAEPQALWSRPALGRFISSPRILPSKGIALAIVEPETGAMPMQGESAALSESLIAVLDLATGASRHAIRPRIDGVQDPLSVLDLAVGDSVIAVLASDAGQDDARRYFILAYDAGSYAQLYRIEIPSPGYPRHVPNEGGHSLLIAGDHLLLSTRLRSRFARSEPTMLESTRFSGWPDHLDPVLLDFDLATGRFLRGLGLAEMDGTAKAGQSGPRLPGPDDLFDGVLARQETLFVSHPRPGDEGPPRLLGYDLTAGKPGPAAVIAGPEDRKLRLSAMDAKRAYYSAETPAAPEDGAVMRGELLAVPRRGGASPIRYSDPYAGDGGAVPLDALAEQFGQTGTLPFTGSLFPGEVQVSGGHVVASAPNTPGDRMGVTTLVIFEAETGARLAILTADRPDEASLGDGFALAGDLLLVSVRRDLDQRPDALHDLVLYRLDYP